MVRNADPNRYAGVIEDANLLYQPQNFSFNLSLSALAERSEIRCRLTVAHRLSWNVEGAIHLQPLEKTRFAG